MKVATIKVGYAVFCLPITEKNAPFLAELVNLIPVDTKYHTKELTYIREQKTIDIVLEEAIIVNKEPETPKPAVVTAVVHAGVGVDEDVPF